jgi:hypothetical protein
VTAVEIIRPVDAFACLFRGWHARVKMPVVGAVDVERRCAVDVHSRRDGEAAIRVQQHREVRVGQLAYDLRRGGHGQGDVDRQEVGGVSVR